MGEMTPKRRRAVRRRKDGTFKPWPGGETKRDLDRRPPGSIPQHNQFQGIAVHIGQMFARDHGRPARVGDLHRTRTASGTYHKQASWYVLTAHGWRKSPTGTTRPSAAQVRAILDRARAGRAT